MPPETTRERVPDRQPLWPSLLAAGLRQAREGISAFEKPSYLEKQALEERICIAYMARALQELKIFVNPNDKYSLAEIFNNFPIKPDYRNLLTRWFEVLVQQGMLHQAGDHFFQLQPPDAETLNALLQAFQTGFGVDQPEQARLIQRFGENHVRLLKGEELPQLILFAKGDLDIYAKLEKESLLSPYNNAIIRAVVEMVVNALTLSNQLNILEVGAGQGISTGWLLPILPSQRTRYTYTDLSKKFLKFGQNKFSQYSFIEYRLFNMEKAPEEQGFDLNGFDLIIANNVIHVSSNMGTTLNNIRSLLAPGGLLILSEITLPNIQFDIIYGLLMPAFNDPSFDNGIRHSGKPFLTKEQWRKILQDHGFADVKNFPESDVNGSHVIAALADQNAQPSAPIAFTRPIASPSHLRGV